jgi:hypothetical protein
MSEIRFGEEMNRVSSNQEPVDDRYSNGIDPEMRISEVHRAIDGWLLAKKRIYLSFPDFVRQDCMDQVFHHVFNRYGLSWIEGLTIPNSADSDAFCQSIASYYRLVLQKNATK